MTEHDVMPPVGPSKAAQHQAGELQGTGGLEEATREGVPCGIYLWIRRNNQWVITVSKLAKYWTIKNISYNLCAISSNYLRVKLTMMIHRLVNSCHSHTRQVTGILQVLP